ncbi:MAG TPA: Xaa-Pro peptidase family protein [Acidimicrobiales bacterium]|nr:Xaa-Pro peptidase family protein [Acidimicrobiales bacterium]
MTSDPRQARRQRFEKVRHRMAELEVDALLLSHGADLPWLTGYRAMPLERLTLLVLPSQGDPVLLVPALEAPRVVPDADVFTVKAWKETQDPLTMAADLLASHYGRFALSDRAWAVTLLGLQERLPGAQFQPASNVTSALRAVKDRAEVEALRIAAQAADRVAHGLQCGEIPLVGRTEREVSKAIAGRLIEEGHIRVNFAIVGSGPNGASPHHDASDRVIGTGEVVVCDFGGEFVPVGEDVGYCSDITRTIVTGSPSSEVQQYYDVLQAAHGAAVAAVRAGVAAQEVDRAARRIIEDAGLGDRFIHRTGHGIGIEEHEDPYMVAGNQTPLSVGHAFSVEPGLYFSGRFGMRLEDIVVVTSGGAESLNHADHELVVVEA